MNIHIAAHYMKLGFRVRRAAWEPEEYMYELADMLEKIEVHYGSTWDPDTQQPVERRWVSEYGKNALLLLEDLLADDWEVITTGIKNHFDEYGCIEYSNQID